MNNDSTDFTAPEPFAASASAAMAAPPRVYGSLSRYVQGEGVMDFAGHFLSRLGFTRCAVLLSQRSLKNEGGRLVDSANAAGVATEVATFGGECSFEEINRHTAGLRAGPERVDGVVAIGGGKVIDAGRAIARRLGVRVAVVPSLASNDAPVSAVSVIYTPEGVTADAELYDENPVLVLVDTGVVAGADAHYLAAGMGDAMATWYEARACARNPAGMTVLGGRPTMAATTLAELCARTIYADGVAALESVRASQVGEALERVVEANTLLSGLGFENGGLAVSHALAQGYTVIDNVHKNFQHGEMVAMGVLAQLMLESEQGEAKKTAEFFARVGLPVHLQQLGLSSEDCTAIDAVVDAAIAFPFIGNMPFEVTRESLLAAVLAADQLGRELAG